MGAPEFEVRPASSQDYEAICRLLSESNLPTSDLTSAMLSEFYVTTDEGRVIGVAALERNGDFGLLRSVAVRSSARRQGVGSGLVSSCLSRARRLGLKAVYLIPNDIAAGNFFARLGFLPISRAEVPVAIQASTEFTHLCPRSYPCLHKILNQT